MCRLKQDPPPDGTVGPRVLILGGAGGVGTTAIQLAKSLFHASFVATTASAGPKAELCQSLGADRVVNYREEKFEEVLASDDESQLFDAIFDTTGEVDKAGSLLKPGGGMCSIVAAPTAEMISTFVEESKIDPAWITPGVLRVVNCDTGLGQAIIDKATGAKRLQRQLESKDATYGAVIGSGDGEVMALLAQAASTGGWKAVIDSTHSLTDSIKVCVSGCLYFSGVYTQQDCLSCCCTYVGPREVAE